MNKEDIQVDEWFEHNGAINVILSVFKTTNGNERCVVQNESGVTSILNICYMMTPHCKHLPDCDGFDWKPSINITTGQYWIDGRGCVYKILHIKRQLLHDYPVIAVCEDEIYYFNLAGKSCNCKKEYNLVRLHS